MCGPFGIYYSFKVEVVKREILFCVPVLVLSGMVGPWLLGVEILKMRCTELLQRTVCI